MNTPITPSHPSWTDDQLAEAIRASTNWRSVMLLLGLGQRSKSSGAIRVVRRRAAELDLDWSHFRGKRLWSDAQLRQFVPECQSWQELLTKLGLSASGGGVPGHIKSHAIRLGLDTSHLNGLGHTGRQPALAPPPVSELHPERRYLRTAAGTLAATWFALRGCNVSLPIEPTDYDLLVRTPEGISRVQVKSTTFRTAKDGWIASVGHHPDTHSKKGQLLAYDPDDIDLFFIVDGDMTIYAIPSRAIAGRVRISLRTYQKYVAGNAKGLLGAADDAGGRASA